MSLCLPVAGLYRKEWKTHVKPSLTTWICPGKKPQLFQNGDTPGLSAGSKAHKACSRWSQNPVCDSGTQFDVCRTKSMKAETGAEELPINHHKHTHRLNWLEWTFTACDWSPGGGRSLKDGGICKAAWNVCILLLSHDWAMSASEPDINTRDLTFTLSAFMWRLYCHTNAGRHL